MIRASAHMRFNSIQAGVFCYYIGGGGGGGGGIVPPFFLNFFSNYHQTWHDSSLKQNLSRAVKVKSTMTSQ